MKTDESGRVEISRKDLYDRVWSTPMRLLAQEFGLSDVGLAKICKRHDIPRPSLGYWAKKQYGKRVSQTKLKARDDDDEDRIVIIRNDRNPESTLREEVREVMAKEADAEAHINVAETLDDCHPLVEATLRSLRVAKPNEAGVVAPVAKRTLSVKVSPDLTDRAMRIMDALVKALESRSYTIKVNHDDKGHSAVIIDREAVCFSLIEDTERYERKPTEQEKQDNKRHPAFYHGPYYAWRTTGRLGVHIHDAPSGGGRVRWKDGKKQQVERCLNDVVAGFIRTAEWIKVSRMARLERERQWREERERRERERQEWYRRRAEMMPKIKAEEEELAGLEEEVKGWHWAEQIRQYLRAIRQAAARKCEVIEEGSELAEWIRWAEAQADRADPLKESPPSVLDEKEEWDRNWY